jgi:RNA polymerase sigma factor (sigma-70 family)
VGNAGLKHALAQLRSAVRNPDGGGLTDGQLLARFVADRDEAAFAALVRRHGPMVLRVCSRILGNADDAEDAFQATFLVLVRKAASVVKRDAVAGFLYGVAYRTAVRLKGRLAKRRALEWQVDQMPHPLVPPAEAPDWRPLLDRELSRLSETYRAPVILCDLEGKTRREAARRLGLAEGTLSSRLARARRLLARRLTKYGLAISGGALAVSLSEGAASAAVPPTLAAATVQGAMLIANFHAIAPTTSVAALVTEVLKDMALAKLKWITVLAMIGTLLAGSGLVYRVATHATPADAEILRKENELLKINVQVLLEKVRSHDTEMSTPMGLTDHPQQMLEENHESARSFAPLGDEAKRRQTVNNLRELAIAMLKYHNAHGAFPAAAIHSKDGKPLLSWRVAILPFIKQDLLYRQFDLNEPWDSGHNKALLARMPPTYRAGTAAKAYATVYQVFTGRGSVFDLEKGTPISQIWDGTTRTVLLGEAAEPVLWTKPEDLPFQTDEPLPKLGGVSQAGSYIAMCDGSVRLLKKTTQESTLRGLITRAGGEFLEGSDE